MKKLYYIGIIFMFLSGIIVLADFYKNEMLESNISKYQINNISTALIEENKEKEVAFDFHSVEAGSTIDILTTDFDGKTLPVIGALSIPEVEILLPVYKGISNEGMYLGATTLKENIQMGEGNYSLGSHNLIEEKLLFGPLENIEMGQMIYLTDLEKIYIYQVYYIDTIRPDRVDILNESTKAIITLLTCDNSLDNRIAVQGKLVEIIKYADAIQLRKDVFKEMSNS